MFIRALDIIMSVRAQRHSKASTIKANSNPDNYTKGNTTLVQYCTSAYTPGVKTPVQGEAPVRDELKTVTRVIQKSSTLNPILRIEREGGNKDIDVYTRRKPQQFIRQAEIWGTERLLWAKTIK